MGKALNINGALFITTDNLIIKRCMEINPHPKINKTQIIDASRLKERSKNQASSSFFTPRKKIIIREVSGIFNSWRWLFVALTQIFFYALPWLTWNDRQAVLFDLLHRKFYLFGLVLWPSDVIYLAILMIIAALALFLFTAVAGRLWCGYACPQTVYTEIFIWIEKKIEGKRIAQMRLDMAPWSFEKLIKKFSKHLIWAIFSLWSGFTLVAYFTPVHELFQDLLSFNLSTTKIFWSVFYGFMMYLLAGWMREQVCKYMCPYARFQSVMFDADTLIVTYDEQRGELRGARKKGIEPKSQGLGDCIDCGVCVDVCPTGIDIRNGLQMECIGCGACIDGCNEIMSKMGYAENLIRYDTENGVKSGSNKNSWQHRILRGRVLVYSTILIVLVGAMFYSLGHRSALKMAVERNSRASIKVFEGNQVENTYRVLISNSDEVPHDVLLSAHGLNSISLSTPSKLKLEPLSNNTFTVKVQVELDKANSAGAISGSNSIEFRLKNDTSSEDSLVEKTIFILPK